MKAQHAARVARVRARERDTQRKADAHMKIEMGGLVIAAGCVDWNPAEVVGALLTCQQTANAALRAVWRERGIKHLSEREAARNAARKSQ